MIWALYPVIEAFRTQSKQKPLRQLATLVALHLETPNQQYLRLLTEPYVIS